MAISAMLATVSGIKWKIFTGIGAVAALSLGVYALTLRVQVSHLDHALNDPVTGCSVRLVTARNNSAVLQTSLDSQNLRLNKLAVEAAFTLKTARLAVDQANAKARAAEQRAGKLIYIPPMGDTLEARVLDVDRRVLEGLDQ